jgi:hypothetical protein
MRFMMRMIPKGYARHAMFVIRKLELEDLQIRPSARNNSMLGFVLLVYARPHCRFHVNRIVVGSSNASLGL